MKKKINIKTLIRQIVREEVAMAIGEVITELKQPVQQVSQPKPKKKIVEKQTFTKNSILNDVLNETAMDEEWKTMGGGTYTSDRVHELMGGNPMMANTEQGKEKRRQVGAVESLKAQGVSSEQVGEDVVNALTRDYSGLMKAMNKKKEPFRP